MIRAGHARTIRERELECRAKELFDALPNLPDRKAYAERILQLDPPFPQILFRMLDGRPVDDLLWKHVRPDEHRTFQRDEP